MSMVHTPDSPYAIERRKWESYPSEFGPAGRAPNFTEFPQMLYRAKRPPQGGAEPIMEHCIVHDENERRNMQSRGFVIGPDNAVKALEQSELVVATAAAERAYQDRNMSGKAKQESAAVDETTIEHLGSIPETPIHKKGWPKGKPRKQVPRG